MRDVRKLPLLSADTEQSLCRRWIDHHDIAAAHQLAGSHLHLVVKIAMGYRGYGLPIEELIGEGHVGLMRAVCRFDPGRGARFATYAAWWVRAAIQQHILHNWSLVKMGTTACIYDPACGTRFMPPLHPCGSKQRALVRFASSSHAR